MKIRRVCGISFLAAVLGIMIAGCGGNKEKTFTVGFDADFPPYGYKDGNGYKGFDLDLAREVCARRGWKFVPKPINWDTKDMELNSGSIDCIWNGFTIQGREKAYEWSEPYVGNSQVVLVKAGSAIKKLADLAGKVVGVQTDTPVAKALSGKDEAKKEVAALGRTFKSLVVMPNYNQAIMDLDMGAVEAVALDIGVAKKKMADLPGKFVMLDEIVMLETYGIGFRKGDTLLRDQVVDTLKAMNRDGVLVKIAEIYGIEPNSIILGK